MSAAALAVSLVLIAPAQEPQSHAQAVTCASTFLVGAALLAQAAEANPSDEGTQSAVTSIGQLLKRADEDRLAAARREGIAIDASGAALNAHLQGNMDPAQQSWQDAMADCVSRYGAGLFSDT
jgi:hypothetical protein